MGNRIIRDWTASDRVDQLSNSAEVFFTRLIMKVDDYGNIYAHTRLLKSSLYPLKESVKEIHISKWINECIDANIIKSYSVAGKNYLHIIDFGQRLDRARAKYPSPENQDLIGYVYLMTSEHLQKIGFSLNPWARVKEIKSPIDKPVVLTMTFKGSAKEEKELHDILREFNYENEWFELSKPALDIFHAIFNDKKNASSLIVAIRSYRSPAELESELESETESETETKAVADETPLVIPWPSFQDFWNLYDKKTDLPKCLKKWEKIKQGAREKIMEHLALYTRATPDRQYRKNPLTYLTHESWSDEIIIPNPNGITDKRTQGINSLKATFAEQVIGSDSG